MNESTSHEGPERRIKSVNFTDPALYDYDSQRAANLYGGNFSGYGTSLIERDRSMSESRRTFHDFEARLLQIIGPYGGRLGKQSDPFDFGVPKPDVIIEARSRFPGKRNLEYQLLSSSHKLSFTSPLTRSPSPTLPTSLPPKRSSFANLRPLLFTHFPSSKHHSARR